ncbi:MAG: endonuclease, partial [Chitinophagaceae bacterium]
MKKTSLFFCFCLLTFSLLAQDLQVMTFNIRLNTERDSLNAWPHRKDNVA